MAGTHGGAVSLVNPMSTRATGSSGNVFRCNSAENGDGGAVYVAHASATEGGEWRIDALWNSTADIFDGNIATAGSGGAIFAIGTKIAFGVGSNCSNNRAPRGGGGCLLWEPLATDAKSYLWQHRAPEYGPNVFSGNIAAYGNNTATPPVSLRPLVDDIVVISADVDGSPLSPAPRVEILDLYGNVVVDPVSVVSVGAIHQRNGTTSTISEASTVSVMPSGIATLKSLALRGALVPARIDCRLLRYSDWAKLF